MNTSQPDILAIKKNHEFELMQIQGVEGVGITDWKGKECLVVYISNPHAATQIPPQIEGVDVKIEQSGAFGLF